MTHRIEEKAKVIGLSQAEFDLLRDRALYLGMITLLPASWWLEELVDRAYQRYMAGEFINPDDHNPSDQ